MIFYAHRAIHITLRQAFTDKMYYPNINFTGDWDTHVGLADAVTESDYRELEGTHKDHWGQPQVPHSTTQTRQVEVTPCPHGMENPGALRLWFLLEPLLLRFNWSHSCCLLFLLWTQQKSYFGQILGDNFTRSSLSSLVFRHLTAVVFPEEGLLALFGMNEREGESWHTYVPTDPDPSCIPSVEWQLLIKPWSHSQA